MVWPCLKVFWFSKDNPTGHSERKKKKRQTEEEVGRGYQRVDGNGLIFVKTNFTHKHIINFKLSGTAIKIALSDKNNLFIRHNHVHE